MIDWTKVSVIKTSNKKELLGIRQRSYVGYHQMIFVINDVGDGFVLSSNPDLYEHDLFDGRLLEDNIDGKMPTELGLYKCQVKIHSFQSNRPDDAEEWDLIITLEDVEKLKSELDNIM